MVIISNTEGQSLQHRGTVPLCHPSVSQGDEGTELFEGFGTDAFDVVKLFDGFEAAVGVTVINDGLCFDLTD